MVNKRTAEVAFKADPDKEVKDVRMKIESESDSENALGAQNNTPGEPDEVMRAAWKKLDVPWKNDKSRDHPGYEGGSAEDVLSIIGCGKSPSSYLKLDKLIICNAEIGTLASAILEGVMRRYDDSDYMAHFNYSRDCPPYQFILNCSTDSSCKRLKKEFNDGREPDIPRIKVVKGENVMVAQAAKYIVLGCKPYMVNTILSQPGMKDALHGKILISICGGVTSEDLEKAIYGDYDPEATDRCQIVRVMPNTAAKINQSMTLIATHPHKRDIDAEFNIVHWLFECVGEVVELPEEKMDAATALAGSGPAFVLLMLEGMIDGAVAMGIPRDKATRMAAQTMKGAALGVMGGQFREDERDTFDGTHPAILRDQVTTPGGCTMGGLMVLEEEGVRGAIAKCIRRTTVVASQLGGGGKNVNGV